MRYTIILYIYFKIDHGKIYYGYQKSFMFHVSSFLIIYVSITRETAIVFFALKNNSHRNAILLLLPTGSPACNH